MRIFVVIAVLLTGCTTPSDAGSAPGSEPGPIQDDETTLRSDPNPLVGGLAPDFAPTPFDGGGDLASMQGDVVLIFVHAYWCTICKGDEPKIVAMHDDYAADGFEIMAVGRDADHDRERDYALGEDWPFPSYHDPEVNQVFQMRNYQPNYVLIDRDGDVAAVRANSLQAGDWDQHMRSNIEALL